MSEQEKRIVRFEQSDVSYTAASLQEGNLCGNCRWFDGTVEYNRCNLVEPYPLGIEATGHCTQWAAVPVPVETPLQVAVVDEDKSKTDLKLKLHRDFSAMLDQLDAVDEKTEPLEITATAEGLSPKQIGDAVEQAVNDYTEGHTHTAPTTIYAAPDTNEPGLIKALADKFKRGLKPGQTTFKAADGKRYMLLVTSNSYQDREQETLTSEALKADVDRHWTQGDDAFMSNNPLLFWHDDRVKMGDIIWADMRGPFYVELAREDDTPVARKLWDAQAASEETWGASHRFAYYAQHRSDGGDYDRIYKQETSILPRDMAANPLTFSGVLPMSSKRDEFFNKMVGHDGAANALDQGIEAVVALLDAQGVEHKSTDDESPPTDTKMVGVVQGFADLAGDMADLDARVEKSASDYETATKAANEQATALKAAVDKVNALAETLQAQLDNRPRRASQAKETEVTDQDLPAEVANSMLVNDPVFGQVKPLAGS